MKDIYPVGQISKQGFHRWLDRKYFVLEEQEQIRVILKQLREDHPRMSSRNFYRMIQPRTMGRDAFESFCHSIGYKVDIRRRKYKTTDSRGVNRFPNLIMDLEELNGINQLCVSDITYYELGEITLYLTFIQDVYNREIIGYSMSESLLTSATTIPALRMAIRQRKLNRESRLIFHSDGGGQYYSKDFLHITKEYGIRNSMGENAYENPFAERINGTIKNDYLYPHKPKTVDQLWRLLTKAVDLYNNIRPHQSLGNISPVAFLRLTQTGLLTKTWIINKKKKVSKKEKVNINIK